MCRALFVPDKNMTDFFLVKQRVINWQNRTARIPKNGVYALILEGLNHHLSASHFL
jgi:hypothetical protein